METTAPTGLTRRKAPQQTRSAATVNAIFEATIQVLLRDGPNRLTTTRVAQRAGVSVGTLYQYFPHKRAVLYAVLDHHLKTIADAIETTCLEHRGATTEAMAEAVIGSYLRAKMSQLDTARAFNLVSVELDARGIVGAATLRGEQAIAAMLLTASDGQFPHPQLVAQILLASVYGTVRAFLERDLPPKLGGEVEQQLTIMCRSYLTATSRVKSRAT